MCLVVVRIESETEHSYAFCLSTDWFDWTEKYTFSKLLPVFPRTLLYAIVVTKSIDWNMAIT